MKPKKPTRREIMNRVLRLEKEIQKARTDQRVAVAEYIKRFAKFQTGNILQSGKNPVYFCCVVDTQAYVIGRKWQITYTYRMCDRNGHGMRSYLANQTNSESQLIEHGYKIVLDSRAALPETKGKAIA